MTEPKVVSPEFTMLVSDLPGSEGPVFDSEGTNFYMVAPEVEIDGKPAGNILRVDLSNNKVCCSILLTA